jgi:hypothetical protein
LAATDSLLKAKGLESVGALANPLNNNQHAEARKSLQQADFTVSAFPMKGQAVNILNLKDNPPSLRSRLGNAYERLAAGDDYQRNEKHLRIIQGAVVTLSAVATGFTNAFAHRERIGDYAAFGLAVLIVVFVERFYFVLRHGLTTCYQAGKQRFFALLCYRIIQATMVLNAAILCAFIVGFGVPWWLEWWNHWSIIAHFALGLLGVQAVRDSDAVVENRMLELKAATAAQDVLTTQRTAAIGSPLVLLAARVRGFFDACNLAVRLLFRRGGLAQELLGEIDALQPKTIQPTRRPGFVSETDSLD